MMNSVRKDGIRGSLKSTLCCLMLLLMILLLLLLLLLIFFLDARVRLRFGR